MGIPTALFFEDWGASIAKIAIDFSLCVIPAPAFAGASSSPRRRGAGIQKEPLKQFYVYILCSKRNGTLYAGVTSDLVKRVYEHKSDLVDSFTRKYNVHRLVWYEVHESWGSAFHREKQNPSLRRQG